MKISLQQDFTAGPAGDDVVNTPVNPAVGTSWSIFPGYATTALFVETYAFPPQTPVYISGSYFIPIAVGLPSGLAKTGGIYGEHIQGAVIAGSAIEPTYCQVHNNMTTSISALVGPTVRGNGSTGVCLRFVWDSGLYFYFNDTSTGGQSSVVSLSALLPPGFYGMWAVPDTSTADTVYGYIQDQTGGSTNSYWLNSSGTWQSSLTACVSWSGATLTAAGYPGVVVPTSAGESLITAHVSNGMTVRHILAGAILDGSTLTAGGLTANPWDDTSIQLVASHPTGGASHSGTAFLANRPTGTIYQSSGGSYTSAGTIQPDVPVLITGLTSGTQYSFYVTWTDTTPNSVNTSTVSAYPRIAYGHGDSNEYYNTLVWKDVNSNTIQTNYAGNPYRRAIANTTSFAVDLSCNYPGAIVTIVIDNLPPLQFSVPTAGISHHRFDLLTGGSLGTHEVDIRLDNYAGQGPVDQTGASLLTIGKIYCDHGSSSTALFLPPYSKDMIIRGDSTDTFCEDANRAANDPLKFQSRLNPWDAIAEGLGYNLVRITGPGWTIGDATSNIPHYYYPGSDPRIAVRPIALEVLKTGKNEVSAPPFDTYMTDARAFLGSDTQIVDMAPWGQIGLTTSNPIASLYQSAVEAYQAANSSDNVLFLNLGNRALIGLDQQLNGDGWYNAFGQSSSSGDETHENVWGGLARIAPLAINALYPIMNPTMESGGSSAPKHHGQLARGR